MIRGKGIEKCEVCNKNKENTKTISTYNRKLITACMECATEMKWTLQCIKITTNWILEKKSEKYQKKSDCFVLTPLKSSR